MASILKNNSWHNIITIFGFIDPESMDIDTQINFLATVVPVVMNGHPGDQAKVSAHCRWPLIRGTDGHVDMSRDIDSVVVHSRWPLTTGVAQGRYYCIFVAEIWDIENWCQPFWKWLPQPTQTNIIATFGFLDPENIDIETIINFLSILFAEIWDIEKSC